VYDSHDVAVMLSDIETSRTSGAAGVVCGALTPDGRIDREIMLALMAAARPMTVGFHRAFDQIGDQSSALETLMDLGVTVVLTSGGAALALDGAPRLRELVDQARGRIDILAGGGITPSNVAELLERSGVQHVHGKAFAGLRAAATPI
jgi:copper homeostasis protein